MSVILTRDQLERIMPLAAPRADVCVSALNAAIARFPINTSMRLAHFLGQLAVESGQLAATRENMNYTAQRLTQVWPTRFTSLKQAMGFAHMPEQIANFVYANRMGNGDVRSGDGWRHRGAGWLQLTGKDNQQACAEHFGVSSDIGDWLSSPQGAALAAAWFWSEHGCNELADRSDIDAISDAVNLGHHTPKIGDAIGYAERLAFTNTAIKVLT
jgi:putative chitinase